MKKILAIITLAALLLCMSATAFAQVGKVTVTPPAKAPAQNNVYQVASSMGNLKTFTGLVDKAGLKDTLSTGGPYTVLAPNDDAFNKLPPGTINTISSNKAMMASFVKNHVIQGRYTANNLLGIRSVKTIDGKTLTIAPRQGYVKVGDSLIVKEDIPAGNGIIQVVGSVIVPK
ncbi:MAG TPA: fasciclin domain-containing protein [Methanocella sp.]|nr:fasciclin domain-containing protein [Methanocella sp.]